MSSLWKQRAGRNEALFREVNENIAQLAEEQQGTTPIEPVFICECANADCTERLAVDIDVYRRVREQDRLFILLPGHQDPQLDQVIETHPNYLIVEKTGEAGDVAERADR